MNIHDFFPKYLCDLIHERFPGVTVEQLQDFPDDELLSIPMFGKMKLQKLRAYQRTSQSEIEPYQAHKPAFPLARPIDESMPNIGLTKREYFASIAMQGLLANPHYMIELEFSKKSNPSFDMNQLLVTESVDMADELLKRLEK